MIKEINIQQVENSKKKKEIARDILLDLAEWFENETANENYIEKSSKMPFIGGFIGDKPLAFIVMNKTSDETCEIFVMGVLKNYHRNHIGRNLFEKSIEILKKYNYEFVQVKTLKEGVDDGYDKTNKFYQALGFRKFEVIEEIWSEDNPCQIYVKSIV